jgi:hypothetical protein
MARTVYLAAVNGNLISPLPESHRGSAEGMETPQPQTTFGRFDLRKSGFIFLVSSEGPLQAHPGGGGLGDGTAGQERSMLCGKAGKEWRLHANRRA